MTFIREIPEEKIVESVIKGLEQEGFTLVYTKDSVEIWADTNKVN